MNYDWHEFSQYLWPKRFPDWVLGYPEWRAEAEQLESQQAFQGFLESPERLQDFRESPQIVGRFLRNIANARGALRPGGSLPKGITRVFISHKQQDRTEALRVAWLANKAGHYFWLDVLDPTLASGGLTPIQTAAVIEMALLNCSHVIALITPRSKPSRWVPYEYGRVKEPLPYSLNAACWLHPGIQPPIPEYLYLGALTNSEIGITRWFLPHTQAIPWKGQAPPALP